METMEGRKNRKFEEEIEHLKQGFSRGLSTEIEEEMRGIYAVLSILNLQTRRVQPRRAAAVVVGGQETQGGNASQFLGKIVSYTCDNPEWIIGGVGAALGVVTIWQIIRQVNELKLTFREWEKDAPTMLEGDMQELLKTLIEGIILSIIKQEMEQFLSNFGSFFSFCQFRVLLCLKKQE